jgi:DNA-binding Lrp family transcriptional regulator
MSNTELRAELKAAKIPYWKIAEKLGVHENTIIRRMRKELSEDDRKAFFAAIAEIKKEETA